LLSSGEIHEYARVTAMLFPYDPKALKSASYEAHIDGDVIYWNEDQIRVERSLKRGERLVLPPNSITFVQVEPQFRLPNYIAIRFNLRITHVHRGLLLGTGPLVDPGFSGKLLIPLHNLTSSPYDMDTNEALIWVEFTKTSYGWTKESTQQAPEGHFVAFPESTKNKSADYYLRKANAGNAIRSSIPDALAQGKKDVANAAKSAQVAANLAESIRNRATAIGLAAIAGVGIAIAALCFQTIQTAQSTVSLVGSTSADLKKLESAVKVQEQEINNLRLELESRKAEQKKSGPAGG